MENNIKYAKDEKCCVCGEQAVAYWPTVDPDIPSYPYCADCLYDAMIDMAKAVWPNDKDKRILAMAMAENAREEYKQTK